jgi:hypothetical protein
MQVSEWKDILKKIEEETEDSLSWSDYGRDIAQDGWNDDCSFCIALKDKGLRLANVDQWGGIGEGDYYGYVYSVTEEDGTVTHFRSTGWYSSHHGVNVDVWNIECVEKVPVQTYEWQAV